jgi:hypothetical protein
VVLVCPYLLWTAPFLFPVRSFPQYHCPLAFPSLF